MNFLNLDLTVALQVKVGVIEETIYSKEFSQWISVYKGVIIFRNIIIGNTRRCSTIEDLAANAQMVATAWFSCTDKPEHKNQL